MSKTEDAQYTKWLEDIKGKLSEDQAKALQTLEDGEALRDVFRGTIREKDYYNRLNELSADRKRLESEAQRWQTERANMQSWFNEQQPKNQKLMKEKEELQAQLERLRRGAGDDDDDEGHGGGAKMKADEFERQIAELSGELNKVRDIVGKQDRVIPKLLTDLGDVITENIKDDYGIPTQQILNHALKTGMSAADAFRDLTGEERAKRAQEKYERELAEAVAKGREEGKAEALQSISSPDHLKPSGPSILDNIADPKGEYGSGAAMKAYLEAQAAGQTT